MNAATTSSELLFGGVDPLPVRVPLRAGPLVMVLEAGDLRSIRLDDAVAEVSSGPVPEIVNRIYGAVRDGEWATVPGRLADLQIETADRGFHVTYVSEHVGGDVDFVWRATIDGAPDGTIVFSFMGEARATFARNRIGLCVLHPLDTCAERSAQARLASGGTREVRFPVDVSVEQPMVGFHDLAGLRWPVVPGVEAELILEGDTFETEDQRNWIDASFKTYSTPLALPRPVVVPSGTRIEQRVTVRVHRGAPSARGALASLAEGREDAASGHGGALASLAQKVEVGLGMGSSPLSELDVARLRVMRPAHLRVDLPLDGDWAPRLARAVEAAAALGCALELALDVGDHSSESLRQLADALPEGMRVARVLVFGIGRMATTPAAVEAVRTHLVERRPGLGPLASGSRMDLYQVHLFDPPRADATCWGMQPQAHATDLTSIAETPVAAGHQVRAVRRRRPGLIAISPITLHRTAADSRQMSLAGAAWTLALLAEIAAAGADSVTLFETAGARGVMADAVGVFPLFHVLADATELLMESRGTVVGPDRAVTGLLLRRALLVANLSRDVRDITVPDTFRPCSMRLLDSTSVVDAMRAPEAFRGRAIEVSATRPIALPPFATARIDGSVEG